VPKLHRRDPPQAALSREIVARLRAGRPTSVTWLNHFSAQVVLREGVPIGSFDHVGLDGLLLKRIVGGRCRTSADLVLPLVLGQVHEGGVAIFGGHPDRLAARVAALEALLGAGSRVVAAVDGFAPSDDLWPLLRGLHVDLLIVGAGAGLQERVALEALERQAVTVAVTCGGFLDQLVSGSYYPGLAYPLRLNWLVRLLREPRRLWRRYTIDAISAMRCRASLRTLTASCRTLGQQS
jgi:UDP-N-acetyl-D-mannosaminuronic acid transferase (WecB/TagA/CpsF family)